MSAKASLPTDILAAKPKTTPTELPAAVKVVEKPVEASEPVVEAQAGQRSQLSVQVDEARYMRFSIARVKTKKKGQQILSEALDLWLEKNKF